MVSEFFELFKTPWEFFSDEKPYSVVLSTDGRCLRTDAKLVVLGSSEVLSFDGENGISVGSVIKSPWLDYGDLGLPTYGNVASFDSKWMPLLLIRGTASPAGVVVQKEHQTILRLGYDLFREVQNLLSQGQPASNASIPTLEIHVSMLRKWILKAGITVIEIPPIPAGFDFTCCLTHDVDFAGIRKHRLDRTVIGFLFRATLVCLADVIRGRKSIGQLFTNWKAVLALPAVYLGLAHDYWVQFDQYLDIERDLASTFFFIPFKDRPGKDRMGRIHISRATKYDIDDIQTHVKKLVASSCEIGLHGIDAWRDSEQGIKEMQRIVLTSGKPCNGVRMHWLYFDRESASILDRMGFIYDSTRGYNDAVGYWGGTSQVFRPPGAVDLLELPLHIQDSALFYQGRMGLSEKEAFNLCRGLIDNNLSHGGVLVVNWHHRSLGPERLWGDFYKGLLAEIGKYRVWFGTGTEVVLWFNKRRMVKFQLSIDSGSADGTYRLELQTAGRDATPGLFLRIHKPGIDTQLNLGNGTREVGFIDARSSSRLTGSRTEEIILDDCL